MFWRTVFQGGPQGAPLLTFVFVLVSCISYTFSQNTAPGNPSISGPIGVLEGSEVTFNCTSIQGIPPPSVVWYRGNNIVDSSYTSGSQNGVTVSFNNYTFNATRFDHGVSFRCVVDNSALTSGPLNRTWIMSVYVPPGTPVLTGPSNVVAGTSYVYRCVTSGGNPAANITWELGGQTLNTGFQNSISQNNDNTFVISSNLSWAPNTADNGKSLSCIVEHRPTLGNNVLTVNRAISVNGNQVVPQVSVTQSVYTRIVGSSVTLSCSITNANPPVNQVWWTRNSNGNVQNITIDGSKYSGSSTSNPSLTISSLQTSDIATYQCLASNGVGTGASFTTFLNITGTTPTVQVGSSSYSVMAGNTANLICSITSQNPAATSITWQRQIGGVTSTVVISSSSRYSGGTVSNPTLTITNVQQSDEGTYFCSASNNIGQGSTAQTFLDVLNLPQTSVSQSQYNINIGNSVTLQCFVSSTPSASSITWRRSSNGVVTTINVQLSRYSGGTVSTPSLTISNVQTSDSGTYSCVATNSVGSSSPANTTLNVIGALPSVSIPSSSYSVNYGGTITIPCQVSSNPFQNTVFWRRTRNGVTTTLSISGKYSGGSVNTPSLTISNTDLQDEGTYTCSATNSAGTTTSNTITLDVIGNAPSVNIPNTQYTVTFGASVTIPCFVTASPTATSVQWTRISNGVTTTLSIPGSNNKYGGGTVSSPSLTISNTDNNDEGTYRCTATNAVSSSTDSAFLDVQGNFPSVSIPQTTYTVSFSGAVTLVCNIQASPSVVSVSWFRILNSGTSLITVSGSNKYSGSTVSTPSLTISNADLSDEGSYQCSAINSVGTGTSGTTFLDVLGNIPSVSIPQSIYTVTYGQDRTITCSVSANPGATSITWQFQTGSSTTTVAVGNTAKYSGGSVSTPSLTIKNAASSDEGNYRCRATNAAGTGESALAFLDVTGNSPSVSIPSSSYSVNYGSTITIPCTINANPVALSINWYKDSSAQPISISGRFSGGSVSTPALTISSTLLTDEGNYRCSATNAVGTGNSFNTFLDVVGNVPSVTITPPSNVVIGNNITITCSYNSNPTATAVAWRRTQGTTTTLTMGGRYSGGSLAVPSLTITNVQSNDQGSYQCVVTNAVGEGQSSSAFVSVQGNVPTVTIPQNSYSVVYGNTITIPCSISSNPSATTMRWERTANFNTDILTTTGSSKYSGGTLSTPSLTILNTDSNDQADYRCIATNQVGDGFSATTSLTVQGDAPIVSIPQDSYSVLIGSNRVLPCTVSAFPAVTSVYWVFDPSGSGSNVNIQQSFGRYVLSPSTSSPDLTVNNAVQSDAGTYSCFAINAVGTVSDTTTLNITGTVPSVDIALSSYSVLTGDSITIPCVVTASPATTSLYWVFDPSGSGSNIQITSSQGRYTVGTSTNNPSLTISNTNSGDVGTYTCTAINQVGQSSDAASLAVTGNVPVVSIPSSSYSALQTSTIVIPCNITNTPVPAVDQVRWFYSSTANNPNPNLVLINSTSRYTGSTPGSPSLTIGGVLNSDQGYYRCSASNPVGTATSGTTFLTVTGAVPSQTTVSQGSALSIQRTNTLTLSCTANGDPAPTIAWSFNGQILTTSGGTYTKANIQRTDDGIYTCTATNSLGSQTATVDVDVQYSPIASSSSVSLSVVVDNSQTLTCNVEANPSVTTWQWSRNGQVVSTGSQTYTKTFSSGDFGDYICTAQNSLGSATVTFTVSQSTLDTGAATAGGGLTSGEIAAIVLAVLLLIILIIVICICCCTHGVCGAICGKKKDPKGRVEPSKEKEVYKETIRQIEIPRFEEKQKPKVRESSAVSRRDVDLKVNNHYRKENEYDIIRYETVPPASTHYGDTIISVQDDVRPSPRPHRLPALTAYTYDEEERRRKRKKKRKHRSRKHRDGTEEVIIEKVRTASPIRVIEEPAVIVERVRSGSPVRYIEEPAQDVVIDYVNPELTTVIYSSSEDPAIVETVRRTPSSRRRRSDEEEMIVERTSSRSPSRRRRHEEHYVTTERVVNGDVYRDGGDLRAINGEVYRHSGEYSLSRHGSGRFTTGGSTRRRNYEESEDVEVVPGEEYYIERR